MFRNFSLHNRGTRVGLFAAALALAGSMAAQGLPASAARQAGGVTLHLVAYSTPSEAYGHIIPAFEKTAAGKGVTFTQSYGASGDQSRAVENGLPADVVAFSLAPDVTRLVKDKLVPANWDHNAYKGMVTDSIVVLVVRKGNPKHIHTWSDLLRKGVEVLTPNPFTSGGARWNIMAAYGAQIAQHRTQKQAVDYLSKLFSHVTVQDKSSREASQTFDSGKGDVLISYENEAINAQVHGANTTYVIPPQTILIENPVAVTTKAPAQAAAFVKYLYSKPAQVEFGVLGYRPVRKDILKNFTFRKPKTLFTIGKFGGWTSVTTKFFDPQNGIVAQIERGHGVTP